jgi:hypothetical protein
MILDMIQVCRYLRRSTDRWLLSKNSTTRLERLESWHEAGLLWNCLIPITNTKGPYLYPCSNTTPSWPRLQHLLPKTNNMTSCWSRVHHQSASFFISGPCHHVLPNVSAFSREKLFCRMMTHSWPQTPLPNALKEISCWIWPTCQSPPGPIFGVNNRKPSNHWRSFTSVSSSGLIRFIFYLEFRYVTLSRGMNHWLDNKHQKVLKWNQERQTREIKTLVELSGQNRPDQFCKPVWPVWALTPSND